MHGCVMENVQKVKIKLENIWIDLIRSIYAPYMDDCNIHLVVSTYTRESVIRKIQNILMDQSGFYMWSEGKELFPLLYMYTLSRYF